MNSKASNKNTNPNQLNPNTNQSQNLPQKKPSQSNKEDLKPISIREKEIPTQSLVSNNSQISDLNIKEKIKISLKEKDLFPHSNLKFKENNEIDLYNLVHLLQSIEEANKAIKEGLLQNQLNEVLKAEENKKEDQIKNKVDKRNNLKEMKDILKLQIEEKIEKRREDKN